MDSFIGGFEDLPVYDLFFFYLSPDSTPTHHA